ncbi:MAG TPA: ABC transporter substrate-binding protein [Casimicrobium sp.]|nr:ABC transporter substrate-binding protein [Casimicrobium sp.]
MSSIRRCVISVLVSVLAAAHTPLFARDFVVGQSVDLSGLSNVGKDFSNGARTYFDSVNARGGVQGRKISFVQLDDSGRAAEAKANTQKLLRENGVDVMLGSTTAESLLAVLAAAAAVTPRVAVLGAPTGIELDAVMLGAAFPTRASYREEARALLDSLRMFHDGPIAIVQGEGPDAPVTHAAIRAEALARGASIAFDGSAAQWQARNSREAKAGAVVISGDALGVAPVAQHTRKLSPQSWLLAFSTVDYRNLFELAGAAASGMFIAQVVPPPGKTIHAFQREHRALMKQFRDEPPSQHTLEGYLVARVLTAAFAQVEGDPTPARVARALRALPATEFGPLRVSLQRPSSTGRSYVDVTAISSKGALLE